MSFARHPLPTADQYARADVACYSFMLMRPDLKVMSFDEWLIQHWDKLTPLERRAASALRDLHPDHRPEGA